MGGSISYILFPRKYAPDISIELLIGGLDILYTYMSHVFNKHINSTIFLILILIHQILQL